MARKQKRDKTHEADPPEPVPAVATKLGALLRQAGVSVRPRDQGKTKGHDGGGAKDGKSARKTPSPPPAPAMPSPHTLPPPAPAVPSRVPSPPVRASGSDPGDAALSTTELRMLNDAYAGARPLSRKSTGKHPAPSDPLSHAEEHDEIGERAARARLAALVAGGVRFQLRRRDEYVEGVRSGVSEKVLARVSSKAFSPEARLDLHGKRAAEVPDALSEFVRKHHRRGARHLLVISGKGLHSEGGVAVLRDVVVEALTQGGAAPLVLALATAHASLGGTGAIAVLLQS